MAENTGNRLGGKGEVGRPARQYMFSTPSGLCAFADAGISLCYLVKNCSRYECNSGFTPEARTVLYKMTKQVFIPFAYSLDWLGLTRSYSMPLL
jgi:hypothetical protein